MKREEQWPVPQLAIGRPTASVIHAGWATNHHVRLHYLETRPDQAHGTPVLVVPGFGESAREYDWLLDALSPRRAVAADLRGRGPSDAPPSGYSWEDHVGDLEAVVDATGLQEFAIVGISRGVSYGLGYALRHPRRVRSFVIGDYQARHIALPPEWPEKALATTVLRGVPLADRMPAHAVRGVQRDAVEVPLWHRLADLGCPVCVVRGTRRGVLVTDEAAERYRRSLPDAEMHMLDDAGHDLWSRDPDRFSRLVRAFLDRAEAAGRSLKPR
jgi:pimeloyl-ACP methyl ester carboxylesterase